MTDTDNENSEEEVLRPRFKISKTRIGEGEKQAPAASGFEPDKVIYAEIDDEITTIFDQIRRARGERIALVVPKRAVLLQSVVNLKILKKKCDELQKEILIVTMDANGMQLAEKARLKTAERLFEKEENAPAPRPLPPMRGERPTRIMEKKISISDVIHHDKKDMVSSFIERIKEKIKKRKSHPKETRLVFIAPNKQAFFTLILVSVLLLLAIAYIALPGATVYITPKSSVLDPSFNVTFLDYEKNRSAFDNNYSNNILVATYPVNPPAFTKKFTYNATGKVFKGANSRGVITIVNLSNAPWVLAVRTRFQTNDGLVFRIPSEVRVPAMRGSTPGTLDVNVTADEFDASGQVIGTRGNIPPTRFFLPGIKNEENSKKLYGESKTPMTGGVTETVKTVSKEDIEAAKGLIEREINKSAVDDLKRYLEEQNLIRKTNFSIFSDKNLIKISQPEVSIQEGLVGQNLEQFTAVATYTLGGTAFDRSQLVDALKERIANRVDPDKKILKVEEDDIGYRFLDSDPNAGKVRLTATMRAIQMYELDPEKENGHRFIKKITDHILGMNIKEAMTYMQQQTDEIASVDIKTWPMWAPSLPNIADNIKFVIKEDTSN
ncbi:hypothetical protein HZA42_04320 [Candidatus Peregrinibacteria bacterium]|nr:hypothetical protein [Candidatus Peregrinibacteria bacterium]